MAHTEALVSRLTTISRSPTPSNYHPTPYTQPSTWRTNAASSSTSTSPASAAPPAASSRPRTTVPFRSASARSTRTAATPARTRHTPSPASFAPWARATTPSTGSPRRMASSRVFGARSDSSLEEGASYLVGANTVTECIPWLLQAFYFFK